MKVREALKILIKPFRKKRFKWYGDDYDEFEYAEPTNRKEEIKLNLWFCFMVFFPLMVLFLIRFIFGFGINLAD